MTDQLTDSPRGWVREHVQRYVDTDGAEGHEWNGVPTLLLVTVGRKSGVRRRTALIYGRSGDDFLVVASNGGNRTPAWFLNLEANPEVEVQVGSQTFTARARCADQDDKPALWREMTRIWPAFDEYQAKADRDIPVVILTPRQ